MKNHTLIELTKEINNLNGQITTLKHELAANTQANGHNTLAYESICKILKEQLEIQQKIFETKGEKKIEGITQQDFYKQVKESLERIEKRLNTNEKMFEDHEDLTVRRTC